MQIDSASKIWSINWRLISSGLGWNIKAVRWTKSTQNIQSWVVISPGDSQILKETLDLYHVPEPIKEAWLAHTDALRPLITSEKDSECDPNAAAPKGQVSVKILSVRLPMSVCDLR